MRYIELNPVRAGMAVDPGDYRWSSYRHRVDGSTPEWLFNPPEYCRLGTSPETCALAYRALFNQPLADHDIAAIRMHLNKDCALGSGKFQDEIERIFGRRTRIALQGIPRKQKNDDEK